MDKIPESIELPDYPDTDKSVIDIDLDIDDNRSVTSNVNNITVQNSNQIGEEDRLLDLAEKLLNRGFSKVTILLLLTGGLAVGTFSLGAGISTALLNYLS